MSAQKPFGRILRLYKAATLIEDLRDSSQGHVITSLLLYCLENGLIKQALVTHMSEEKPWRAEALLTDDPDVIKIARGSKYVFVGQRHLHGDLVEQAAVVGLPCQLELIQDMDVLKIGLFCGMNQSERKLQYALHRYGAKTQDVISLTYRDAKSSRMIINLRDGRSISLSSARIGYFFTLPMCKQCLDFSAHHADIAVGDFNFQGTNAVIVRTWRGLAIFEAAIAAGYIEAEEITLGNLLRHRTSPMVIKELGYGYKFSLCLRHSKRNTFLIPLSLLNLGGVICILYYKYVISYLVLLIWLVKKMWRRLCISLRGR